MTDVLVIGGGPAGIAAAIAAVRCGARVHVVEENRVLGGQYYQRPAPEFPATNTPLVIHDAAVEKLLQSATQLGVTFSKNTLVWGIFEGGQVACCRITDGKSWIIRPKTVVLATGAFQRVVPFPGWTLPQVITAGGAQNLLKHQGVLPGRRVVVAGSGPFLMVAADQLTRAGAHVVALIEAVGKSDMVRFALRLPRHPNLLVEALRYGVQLTKSGTKFRYGQAITEVRQAGRDLDVSVSPLSDTGQPLKDGSYVLQADLVCIGHGFVPATELARLYGCEVRLDSDLGSYVPLHDHLMETSVPGVFVAGEIAGTGGIHVAETEGHIAGVAAAWRAGCVPADKALRQTASARRKRKTSRAFAAALNATFRVRPGLYDVLSSETLVCRCEEISAGAVRDAIAMGDVDVNAIKARTRAGMGNCQGRMCEQNVRALVSLHGGGSMESAGMFTARPPIKPLPLEVIAGLSLGDTE